VQLVDVLVWAVQHGVSEEDVRLLVEVEQTSGKGRLERYAQERGFTPRTLRRRRTAALEAVRATVPQFLAAIA
jgi:hypothetical protein